LFTLRIELSLEPNRFLNGLIAFLLDTSKLLKGRAQTKYVDQKAYTNSKG